MTDQPAATSGALPFFESGAGARKLVDSVVDYALYLLDLDGVVRSWHPGAQRINGYRAEEIIGSNFSVFYAENDVRAGEPARALRMARTDGRFEAEGWRVRKELAWLMDSRRSRAMRRAISPSAPPSTKKRRSAESSSRLRPTVC